jgi:hypothetical protein
MSHGHLSAALGQLQLALLHNALPVGHLAALPAAPSKQHTQVNTAQHHYDGGRQTVEAAYRAVWQQPAESQKTLQFACE